MKTIRTLFSGGEGVGVGAREAGLVHVDGFEYDDKIAQVARDNGFNTITADVLDIDPHTLQRTDVLHASPVCTNASVANSDGEESPLDRVTARKTAEFVTVLKPDWFTLENVYPYRKFESFGIITDALTQAGYSWDYWHVNSADYGVPQTRKRLILIARLGRGQRVTMPPVTHHNPADYDDAQMVMFAPQTKPWVGWYAAIEDLIPTLPESEFANWQLKRLPDEIKDNFLPHTQVNSGTDGRYGAEPSTTIAHQKNPDKAFILAQGKYNNHIPKSMDYEPVGTITSNTNQLGLRAFIADGKLSTSGNNKTIQINHGNLPVDNGLTPSPTVSASNGARALLVDYSNTSRDATQLDSDNPAMTVSKWHGRRASHAPHAWLQSGRVVKMTPRALARFQSLPDDYKLPQRSKFDIDLMEALSNALPPHLRWAFIERESIDNALAVKILGNAVPPLLYQCIAGVFE